MSDFLMRMVSRAVGLSSTIAPRLPYQIGYAVTRQQGPPHPSRVGPLQFASRNAPHEVDSSGRSELESAAARSPYDSQEFFSPLSHRTASDASEVAHDEILPEPIRIRSRKGIRTENDSPDSTPGTRMLPYLRKPRDTNQRQSSQTERDRVESKAYQSTVEGIEENAENDSPAAGRETQSFANESPATPPGRNAATKAPSRQRTPSPEPDSVEVKIGRVEVIMENPAPPLPTRPTPPRGFGDYAALRRYSPQAWNRRNR